MINFIDIILPDNAPCIIWRNSVLRYVFTVWTEGQMLCDFAKLKHTHNKIKKNTYEKVILNTQSCLH